MVPDRRPCHLHEAPSVLAQWSTYRLSIKGSWLRTPPVKSCSNFTQVTKYLNCEQNSMTWQNESLAGLCCAVYHLFQRYPVQWDFQLHERYREHVSNVGARATECQLLRVSHFELVLSQFDPMFG